MKGIKESVVQVMETAVKKLLFLGIFIILLVWTISTISALPPLDDGAKAERRGHVRDACDFAGHRVVSGHSSFEFDPEEISEFCDYVEENPEEAEDNVLESPYAGLFSRLLVLINEERERINRPLISVEYDPLLLCTSNAECGQGYACYFEDSDSTTGYRISSISHDLEGLNLVPLAEPNNGEGNSLPAPRVGDSCEDNGDCVAPDDSLDCDQTTKKCVYADGFGSDDDDSVVEEKGVCFPFGSDSGSGGDTTIDNDEIPRKPLTLLQCYGDNGCNIWDRCSNPRPSDGKRFCMQRECGSGFLDCPSGTQCLSSGVCGELTNIVGGNNETGGDCIDNSECLSGYICNNGVCLAHNNSNQTCTDSDTGKNYTIRGTVTVVKSGIISTFTDFCSPS